MNRAATIFLLLVTVLVAGCRTSRLTTEALPPPAPSVNLDTDSLFRTAPPVLVPVTQWLSAPPETLTVTETRPVTVTRYLRPRPDSTRSFRLVRAVADSVSLWLHGLATTTRYRLPVPGERLVIDAAAGDDLTATITGSPLPRSRTVRTIETPRPLWKEIRTTLKWLIALVLCIGFAAIAIRLS